MIKYKKTRYDGTDAFYHHKEVPLYGFSLSLASDAEKFNLIGLFLRDYADTFHNQPGREDEEAECRALAAWCDDK